MSRPRRIVVCDSLQSRARELAAFLERDPELEVVAGFGDVARMTTGLDELEPDLLVLDLETLGDAAAEVVEPLARERRVAVVLLLGGVSREDPRVTAALTAGALEAIGEDGLRLDDHESVWAVALRSRLRRLANVRPRGAPPPRKAPGLPPWRRPGATYRAIGVGASVGGPSAVAELLGRLPSEFPLPLLVVQHMARGFGAGLTKWLDGEIPLPVRVAEHGQRLQPGVWMAPEDAHLRLEPTMRLSLDSETERGAHRPSLDVLFESLAAAASSAAVGIVLTGMGRDGAEGVRAIAGAGGLTIAQDAETSAVFGMPAAAIESGAGLVLSLEEMAAKLATLRARSLA